MDFDNFSRISRWSKYLFYFKFYIKSFIVTLHSNIIPMDLRVLYLWFENMQVFFWNFPLPDGYCASA